MQEEVLDARTIQREYQRTKQREYQRKTQKSNYHSTAYPKKRRIEDIPKKDLCSSFVVPQDISKRRIRNRKKSVSMQ